MRTLITFMLILFGLLLIPFNSCSVPGTQAQLTDTIPIEKFALEFIEKNPDFDNNEITREQASVKFKAAFIENVEKAHLLDSIPVKFDRAYKTKDGKGYMAQFSVWTPPYNNYFKYFDKVMVDILTNVSEEEIMTLKEKEFYFLKSKFISDIESIDVFERLLGGRTMCITYDWGVKKNNYGKNDICLGMMYVDTDSIISYSRD